MISLIYPLIIGYWLDVVGFCVIFYLEQRGFIVEIKFTASGEVHTLFIPGDMVFRGNLSLLCMGLKELPDLSGVTVTGDFDCSCNELMSLQGAPKSVGGNFDCSFNKLTSLQGAPQSVGGNFDCFRNKYLMSLDGAPQTVGGDFDCSGNKLLMSLDGFTSEIGGDFICDKESLKAKYEEIQLAARVAAKQKEISGRLTGRAKQRKK